MTFCQVCFLGSDAVVRESMNAGIAVLLVVTALVLACFGRFFATLARRSRESAHLVGASEPSSPTLLDPLASLDARVLDR